MLVHSKVVKIKISKSVYSGKLVNHFSAIFFLHIGNCVCMCQLFITPASAGQAGCSAPDQEEPHYTRGSSRTAIR